MSARAQNNSSICTGVSVTMFNPLKCAEIILYLCMYELLLNILAVHGPILGTIMINPEIHFTLFSRCNMAYCYTRPYICCFDDKIFALLYGEDAQEYMNYLDIVYPIKRCRPYWPRTTVQLSA